MLAEMIRAGVDVCRVNCSHADHDGIRRIPTLAVEARDETGAGDVFAAMCAYGLAMKWEPPHLLAMATAAGTLLTGQGRAVGVPALAEINSSATGIEAR